MELEKKSPRGLNCVRVTAADSRAETPLAIPHFAVCRSRFCLYPKSEQRVMPPKGRAPASAAPAKSSNSTDLIKREKREVNTRGKREVNARGGREVGQARKSSVHKDQFGRRPTTTKALVLRNGKMGAMGTGEMAPFNNKISGREKLELLAGLCTSFHV
jgi:hypothetical protein